MHSDTTSPPFAELEELFGRDQLLDGLGALLHPAARRRVVVLHGDAGSGKSAVAAALAARWRQAGGRSEAVDVRAAVAGPVGAPRLLVADLGRASVTTAAWRRLLSVVRAEDRLLVVARTVVALPLDDARVAEVRVAALSWDDSVELLAREGIAREDRPPLIRWAGGSPLLLVLGAQARLQHPGWEPECGADPDTLTERLARRLGPARLDRGREVHATDAASAEVRAAAEQAVRSYQCVDRLAENPLADGATGPERVEQLRAMVDRAIDRAFGSSHGDAGLREVIVAGYVVAATPHEVVADELYLSRSTYFRRLSTAVRRVSEQIVADEHRCAGEPGRDGSRGLAQASSRPASALRERMPSLS